jgi:hypothetical protein
MDLAGYSKFMEGKLTDWELPQKNIDAAEAELASLPKAKAAKTGKW